MEERRGESAGVVRAIGVAASGRCRWCSERVAAGRAPAGDVRRAARPDRDWAAAAAALLARSARARVLNTTLIDVIFILDYRLDNNRTLSAHFPFISLFSDN